MIPLSLARSFLFVPGDDARKLESALRSSAEAVIVDLEDGVAPARKDLARTHIGTLSGIGRPPMLLARITPGDQRDVDAIANADLDAIVLAKANVPAVDAVSDLASPLIALIETAEGVRDAFDIARRAHVEALMLGSLDLSAELSLRRRVDGAELTVVRSVLVLASAAAAIRPPIDGVCPNVNDAAALDGEIEIARDLGFGGKACIHPRQIAAVHAGFNPSATELEWAHSVVCAFEHAIARDTGVTTVDGELVDRPVYLRARHMLEMDQQGGER